MDDGSRTAAGRKKEAKPGRDVKKDWDGTSPGKARNTRIIAFCQDGSTIIFDSQQEAALFFDLGRIDTLRRYIDNGFPMPDGTTFCDYLLTEPDG